MALLSVPTGLAWGDLYEVISAAISETEHTDCMRTAVAGRVRDRRL